MMKTYNAYGARLAYEDVGSGVPVVFLHPTPLDHDYWRPMIAELQGLRAIAPDLRGHGASELGTDLAAGGFTRVPDAPVLSVERLAQDVLKLLDELQMREAVFAGCSIGGYVLLELWRRAPERMRGLAFVCSKPQPDADAALAKRAENIAKARAEGVAALFDGLAKSLVGETTQRERPEIVSEVRSRMTLNTDAFVAVQAGLAARPDSVSTVSTIAVPILAIPGGEDNSVQPADMEAFRAAPGGCEFHLLANAGHFAAYERPREGARLFSAWLQKLES